MTLPKPTWARERAEALPAGVGSFRAVTSAASELLRQLRAAGSRPPAASRAA